jgi:nicotinamide mononucleotide adenylyltransferase
MILTILLFGLNSLAIVVVYLLLSKKLRNNAYHKEYLQSVRGEIEQIIIELNQTTDRNIALIEERVEGLRKLLAKADKNIVLLQKTHEKEQQSEDVYKNLRKKAEERRKMASATKNEEPKQKDVRLRVRELAAEGMTKEIIASRMEMTIGEVELILSLGQNKG